MTAAERKVIAAAIRFEAASAMYCVNKCKRNKAGVDGAKVALLNAVLALAFEGWRGQQGRLGAGKTEGAARG